MVVLIIAFISFEPVFAENTANQTLQMVHDKLMKAKDYSVNANIKVDMPFIRMLPIDAEIYFKQKDKFRVKSKGIAVVPKQGFGQASKMLADTNSFTAVQQGTEMIAGTLTTIINIIPLSDTSDLVLGKLWIDTREHIILKSQLTTRNNGTIVMEYIYNTQTEFGLPDKMIFSIDVKKFKLPKNIAPGTNDSDKDKADKTKDNKKGKIIITLSNYQVNKGLPDSLF